MNSYEAVKPEFNSEKIALRMREAEWVSGISKSKLYEEIAAGRLKSVKCAGRRLILRDDLEAYLRAAFLN